MCSADVVFGVGVFCVKHVGTFIYCEEGFDGA